MNINYVILCYHYNMTVLDEKIPKVIHYVWVGGGPKGPLNEKCIKSFQTFNPDYEIIEWNEKTAGLENHPWVKYAIEHKNWALAADVIRIYILMKYGGIYLDTDCEILKPLDQFLDHQFFIGYENSLWLNTAVIGCVKNHPVIVAAHERYNHPIKISFTTNILSVHNLSYTIKRLYNIKKLDGKTAYLPDNVVLYAADYFYPQNYMDFKMRLTDNSHIIHLYSSSWHSAHKKRGARFARHVKLIVGNKIFKIFEKMVYASFERELKREYKRIQTSLTHTHEDFMNTNLSNDNLIEVIGLEKNFSNVKAINNISFNVKRGSFFAFLGLNGAGKSTTINILCSIIKKTKGVVKIAGLDLDVDSSFIKRKIGIVFQESVLDNVLTVKDNLLARASLYGMSKQEIKERIDTLTQMLDLSSILERKFSVLSGGQKRRVDIARALLHSPELLFLDEPTTGLDPNTRVMVWQLLNKLRAENNLTVFLTTHYMEEVATADNVVILDNGVIAASGTPDYLKSTYTSDYLRIITDKNIALEGILTVENSEYEYRNNSYFIKVKDSKSALSFLNKYPQIKDFEILKGDMDDVFLTVTGKKLHQQEVSE